ncbi:MAG: protein translocase SEC61 complex subunit gamma [Crenarchaeota archaeon]|nr:protein translocase SEC61 complex subunit gamma [Thermoproteota archaeon]
MIGKYWEKLTRLIEDWKLILALASKPSPDEFNAVMKVVGIAALIIGAIAYVIRLVVILTLYG